MWRLLDWIWNWNMTWKWVIAWEFNWCITVWIMIWLIPHQGFSSNALLTAIFYTFVTQTTPTSNNHALSQQPLAQAGINASLLEMGAVQGKRTVFSTCSCIYRRTAVAHSEPRKASPKRSPKRSSETSMLSATFGCTHLLKQNLLISKGRCRKWHHKMKVSCRIYPAIHPGKG